MLTEKEFEKLLTLPESRTLDFKLEGYDLNKHDKKAAFIKDILAMANTLRNEPAYIILGVKEVEGRVAEIPGLEVHRPDDHYQQIINSHVEPAPSFQYFKQPYDGKLFGVFEIYSTPLGPFSSKTHFGKDTVREGAIYWRQGSTNAEVTPFDYQQARQEWDAKNAAVGTALVRTIIDEHARVRQMLRVLDNARNASEVIAFLKGAPELVRKAFGLRSVDVYEWLTVHEKHTTDLLVRKFQPTTGFYTWTYIFFGDPQTTTVAAIFQAVARVEQACRHFDPSGKTLGGAGRRATVLVGRRGRLTKELRDVIVDLNNDNWKTSMYVRTYDSVVEAVLSGHYDI